MHDLNAIRYVHRYEIAKNVPFNSTISYAELASKCSVDESQLKQMLRHLMVIHVFCEPSPNHVAHTASSKLLLHKGIGAFSAYMSEDGLPLVAAQIPALEKWGHGSQEPTQAAFNYAYNTEEDMYSFYEHTPAPRERFSDMLTFVSSFYTMSREHAATGFDWASLGAATVVDIAGNLGNASVAIARANSQLKCVVQDLPAVIKQAQDPATSVVPEDLQDRISFMVHSFYEPQPIKADVYFIRQIMHDYSDKYCIKILRAILTAMKPGSRIVIMDKVRPPVGVVPPVFERMIRTMDLQMMALTNAKERDKEEWAKLVHDADARLKIRNVVQPPLSSMSLIEIVLEDGLNGHGDGHA